MTLFATILALVASIASGGGVSRFVHMMVAHGGTSCSSHAATCLPTTQNTSCGLAGHGHGSPLAWLTFDPSTTGGDTSASSTAGQLANEDHRQTGSDHCGDTHHHPMLPGDECLVCAELAVQLLTPTLASPFDLTVEVLAMVHEREAARQPNLLAPRVFCARPPPALL